MMEILTLYDLFEGLDNFYQNKPVLEYRNDKGQWQALSVAEVKEKVYSISAGLIKLGFGKGSKISLISETRYEWMLIDFAMIMVGIVNVPIYPNLTPEQVEFIIDNSDSNAVFVSSPKLLDRLLSGFENASDSIEKFIIIDGQASQFTDESLNDKVLTLDELMQIGAEGLTEEHIKSMKTIGMALVEDDLASILYTSGTTGIPKGVMLCHRNFISNARNSNDRLHGYTYYDNILVFLPLSHVFARACNYAFLWGGATLWYASDPKNLAQDFADSKPDGIIIVPRVFQKLYEKLTDAIDREGGVKQKLFYWADSIAKTVGRKKNDGEPLSLMLKLKHFIADKLVFKKIRQRLGGRLKVAVTASTQFPTDLGYFFAGVGITITEGYGLTETSPVICVNSIETNKLGTAGKPFEDVQIKLSDDNELLVKGPNVMLGYYKNKEATERAFTSDGWFKTNDICEIDDEGYVRVIERKDDIVKTLGGVSIAPQKIENIARLNPYVEEFVVIAEHRKFVSAIILPNFDKLIEFMKSENLSFSSISLLIKKRAVISLYQSIIDDVNKRLADFEQIRKFIIIAEPFTIENKQLTPTLKVIRKNIEKKYKNQVDKLYD